MRNRPLGRTGLQVSEIGFGAWGIGGKTDNATSYGETDDLSSLAALNTALDQGITFFDTSSVYGYGHSETLIGKAISGRRDRAVVATKAGYARWDQAPDYRPEALRLSLQGSLDRLGTDYVDLLQLHNASADLLRADPAIVAELNALVAIGKIRAWGVSVRSPSDGVAMIREFGAPVLQANFNMLDIRAAEAGLIALAAETGTGFIARTPLSFGFLSGAITRETAFGADDHRSRWPRRQVERWIEGSEALYQAAGPQPSQSRTQIALRFCLSYPISSVIPGMLSSGEVTENAAASDFGPLPEAAIHRIEALHKVENFFVG